MTQALILPPPSCPSSVALTSRSGGAPILSSFERIGARSERCCGRHLGDKRSRVAVLQRSRASQTRAVTPSQGIPVLVTSTPPLNSVGSSFVILMWIHLCTFVAICHQLCFLGFLIPQPEFTSIDLKLHE